VTPSPNLSSPTNLSRPEITKINLGHYTQGIAFTPGAIWVGYDDGEKKEDTGVFRLDASTNQIVTVVKTGRSAGSVAAGEGSVWVANLRANSVTRIDPETNRIVATVAVGKFPFGLDVGEGSVWVTNAGSNTVSRIDTGANAVVASIPVGKQPAGIVVCGGSIWVANLKGKSISRIDPKSNAVIATIGVHGEPVTLTARGTDVWASTQSRAGFSVVRIDAKSDVVVAETNIVNRGKIGGTALLGDVLWVADRANGTLSQVDIQTNALVGNPILVGYDATILGSGNDGNGAIWLSNSSDGTVRRLVP
jgi:YVTN family beta-propeller protein